MNIYLRTPFCSFYEFYYFKKILIFKKLNRPFSLLKNRTLELLLLRAFWTWQLLFKPTFWISRKNKKKHQSLRFFATSKKISIIQAKFLAGLRLLNNTYLIYIFYNNLRYVCKIIYFKCLLWANGVKNVTVYSLITYKKSYGEGAAYIRGLFLIFFVDACITDDEPLWEPIEWSLVQTWILFIFIFAWIAENLITSRYGSYTGRDKRIWFAWYKTFWLIELSYMISFALAAFFVIVPFYYELTYSVSFIFSWWNWYTRIFFFKFISLYTILLLIAHLLQINIRWLNWKKLLFLIVFINIFIAYLLYTHFIMTFFGYFTNPLWYQKTRFIDYVQLSHEPLKWGWGPSKRDHFSYHKVSTVFWFKNDGPFAGAFLLFHMFFFLSIFFLYLYWLVLLRRVYTTKEITTTFTTFCFSALKQFYYFFFLLYALVFMSFIVCYWRFPIEFFWMTNTYSWIFNFTKIIFDYPFFILSIFC